MHSEEYLPEGKSEKAKYSVVTAAKIFSLSAMRLLNDKELLDKIKKEHKEATSMTE